MGYQVFVSYRRDGGESLAQLISERLKQCGIETFYDVESLRSGKFNEKLYKVIDVCKTVVVILPPNALARCENQEDWVRKEVSYAIKTGKKIIPVMMRNFEFPEELPADIDEIRNYNGVSANMEYFDAAFAKLLSMINDGTYITEEKVCQLTDDEELREKLCNCIKALGEDNSVTNMTALAECYKKLHNDSLNEEMAQLYSRAAQSGYAPAQNALGTCYYEGRGVEKNIEKAFEWYRKAAEQGLSQAQYNLARLFERHYKTLAFIWMKKASEQSNPQALYKVGEYYEYGRGVKRNYDMAKKHYLKAEEKGYAPASKKTKDGYWKKRRIQDIFVEFI